jgi:hypothetical protein
MTPTSLFCVIYRTGGTRNFKWHRSLAMPRQEAEAAAESVRRMGYVAHIEHFNLSISVGLPETYEVGGGPIDPEDWVEYEDRAEAIRSMRRLSDDDEIPFN